MASDRFMKLLESLKTATIAKTIKWEETADESAFRVGLGPGVVRIDTHRDSDNDEVYRAVLLDEHARTLDDAVSYQQSSDQTVNDLFVLARTSALRVDEVIDQMMDSLTSGKQTKLAPEKKKKAAGDDDIPF